MSFDPIAEVFAAVRSGGSLEAPGEALALKLAGVRFSTWTEVRWTRTLDAVSTFSARAAWDELDPTLRAAFAPLSFAPVTISALGELMLTGTALGPSAGVDAESRSIAVSGYGLPGVLADSTFPLAAFPLGCDGLTLEQIARKVATLFGLSVVYEAPTWTPDEVKPEPSDKPWEFLSKLAKQRGVLLSDTPAGELRLHVPAAGSPVATFAVGERPLTSIQCGFRPQSVAGTVTGLAPTSNSGAGGAKGAQHTERLALLTSDTARARHHVAKIEDLGAAADLAAATRALAGRMLGASMEWTAAVPTWRTPRGKLWRPGDVVTIESAPDVFIRRPTDLMVRGVEFARTDSEEGAVLTLVPPGAFTGELPTELPW